jgi:hypothetical protein
VTVAIQIKHKFISGKADGPDTTLVKPSNWNDTHDLDGLATGVATFLETPSSANLAAAVTDETGSGALVFATSPSLTTPNLGTPSAATLTNATGLPVSTGISGLGTGVSSFLATPSSANLASAVTDETGSGALVFGTNPTISGATLSGGSINNAPIGATTPTTGAFTILRANYLYTDNAATVGSFTWDSSASSPANATTASTLVTSIHTGMRRCVMSDAGVVQYYLSATDSTKKIDGTTAALDGTDGMVMVEIPKFYTKRAVSGTLTTWSISAVPLTGFTVHPAFVKNGVEVNFRYYSAYDACIFDVSASAYISGLNWANNSGAGNGVAVDVTASTGDKLASVSGIYPMVGLTRAEFRTLAANRGTGWRQLDWTLFSAVQLLYLIEYQTFYSQDAIGNGNTRHTTWPSSSGTQTDSRANNAGLSNGNGNATANSASGTINTADNGDYMSYRGIENFFGNVWNWADGVIVNPDGTASANQGDWWFTNNSADFSDSVKTNMTQITAVASTAGSGFVSAIAAVDNFFVPTAVSGASSSTYITDQFFGSTSADRVVRVGGSADRGASAGAFVLIALNDSSNRDRAVGGRLAF